jgi:uncharacterized protein YjbJ (UPF0337 family)
MGANSDELKGRVKEAAGALSGDKNVERAGKADRAAASAKRKARDATRKVDDVIDAAKEKAVRVSDGSRKGS